MPGPPAAPVALQDREDLGLGRQEQRGPLVEHRLVGLQRAQEAVERRVPAERVGVDPHRLGLALGPEARGFLVGLGRDPGLLPLGLGDHPAGVALALGAELLGDLAALRLHALEHALLVCLRQEELADVDVDDLDAVGRQRVGLDRVADLQRPGSRTGSASSADETNEANGIVAERGADLGEHDVGELDLGVGAGRERLDEALAGRRSARAARLRITTFFLSAVRYSASAGLE